MGLLEMLKSTLGLGRSHTRDRSEPAGEVDVTVEHEPDAPETGVTTDPVDTGPDDAGDAEPSTEDEPSGGDVPVDELSGIGAAYADRLAEAEVETVADLAAADAESVAEAADIAASRIERWSDQAGEY